jgi:ribosomal protein L32
MLCQKNSLKGIFMAEKLVECKTCGHKIAKSVRKCPSCGAKRGSDIFSIILGFILASIGFSLLVSYLQTGQNPLLDSKDELESQVLSSLRSDLEKRNISCMPDSLTLVKASGTKYDGIVYFPHEITLTIEVTKDESSFLWKIESLLPISYGCN